MIVVIVLCRIGLGEDHPFGVTTLGAFKKQYVCTSLCQSSYDVGRMYSLFPHHFALQNEFKLLEVQGFFVAYPAE